MSNELIIISLEDLRQREAMRPPGYVDAVLSRATWVNDTHYALTESAYDHLVEMFARPAPLSRDQWGLYPRALARLAIDSDRGLGDVVHRYAAKLGGEAFTRIFKKITGLDCGCSERQQWLNDRFPLNSGSVAREA